MTIRVLLLLCLFVAGLWAQPPNYEYIRKQVENENPNDKTPSGERVFVMDTYGRVPYRDRVVTAVVRLREGMTLREIIDGAGRKERTVGVVVLRRGSRSQQGEFGGYVRATDKPTFVLKAEDVILLREVLHF